MSRPELGTFIMRPLHTMALEAEFLPPSDPQHRLHTLARLACATFEKGEPVEGDFIARSYRPSWAPNVESTVSYTPSDPFNAFLGIELTIDEHPSVLSIYDSTNTAQLGYGEPSIVVADQNIPLQLGVGLNAARSIIADTATNFFNIAHRLG